VCSKALFIFQWGVLSFPFNEVHFICVKKKQKKKRKKKKKLFSSGLYGKDILQTNQCRRTPLMRKGMRAHTK
jgi:hypothetical protein